jgi:hypothetical protein
MELVTSPDGLVTWPDPRSHYEDILDTGGGRGWWHELQGLAHPPPGGLQPWAGLPQDFVQVHL